MSHTFAMKVAVSIPGPIFEAAERVAKRFEWSRSELYAKAVAAFVREQGREDITVRLNRVYAEQDSTIDPAMEALSLEILRRETW